jgi:DNA-binding NarL/FixJ family response regulator
LEGSTIRVLVVDDFEPWRRFVHSMLQKQPELQIVGDVSDGLEAVHKAQELQPDLVLLDIGLPTLNGIEVARRIRENAPQSKILFVSENRSPDIAREALRTGARGYVVKSDAAKNLLPAVESVLQDRQFVSASLAGHDLTNPTDDHTAHPTAREKFVTLPPKNVEISPHNVAFYPDDASLVDGFARFVEAALKAGKMVIVIATESHQTSLLEKLRIGSVDVGGAVEQGRYIPLNAADTLSTIMVNDMPDPARFMEAAGNLLTAAVHSANGRHPGVAAVCGECDPPLWTLGDGEAAIRLEQLWNEIAARYDVEILCGYPLGSFQGDKGREILERICAEHSAVHIGSSGRLRTFRH